MSVVLSARNAGADVARSLDSAVAAVDEDDEIIAIDDGSTDDTHDWMRRALCDAPHRIVRTDGVGLTRALKLGLQASQGRFVARLDAGDTMSPERLRVQLACFDRDPSLVACGGNVRYVDEKGRALGTSRFPSTDVGIRVCLWAMSNPLIHSTLLLRADALRRVGDYREYFRCAQDFDLLLRLSTIGRLHCVHTIVGDYVLSTDQGITSTRPAEQRWYGSVARTDHFARMLGFSYALPERIRHGDAVLASRIRLARHLTMHAMQAGAQGHPVTAYALRLGARCLFPVARLVGDSVRIGEALGRPWTRRASNGS